MSDLWLLKFAWPAREDPLAGLPRDGLQAWRSTEGGLGYAYLSANASSDPAERPAADGDWRRLECTLSLPGGSALAHADYHYVVETDVLASHEDNLNAWYVQEHLPALAALPGVVRAARYVDDAGSPRHYACYDLASLDVFDTAAWLAVRYTDWSSRIRPAFRNTRRTRFRRP
jgi:hypothetical protein